MNKLIAFITAACFLSSATAKDITTSKLPEGAVTQASVERAVTILQTSEEVQSAGAITDAMVEQSTSTMIVTMNIHPNLFSKKMNREVSLLPMITKGDSAVKLPEVIVAGKNRYFQHEIHDGANPPYVLLRAGEKETYNYSVNIPIAEWMKNGNLTVVSTLKGCCNSAMTQPETTDLASFDFRDHTLHPAYIYIKPMAELEKSRTVSGEAYIDFPVRGVQILPDYRRNPQELEKIRSTIATIQGNKDINISSLTIKGFASPEGPYAANETYAHGRTEALINYVAGLFHFPKSVLHSQWVAEDWEGLARRVKARDLVNKDAILAVINDKTLAPDVREARLRTEFPEQYAFMLANIFPALRRSDYKVDYVVRHYSDPVEIAEVMRTAPQHLSLEELFIYAKSLNEQSPEFKEVMEVAVRMFPSDPTANLNAATTAIGHGEYDKAAEYLDKADRNFPTTIYTRGVLAACRGDLEKAIPYLEKAKSLGVPEASELLNQINELTN